MRHSSSTPRDAACAAVVCAPRIFLCLRGSFGADDGTPSLKEAAKEEDELQRLTHCRGVIIAAPRETDSPSTDKALCRKRDARCGSVALI
jgi:hypothetical protein